MSDHPNELHVGVVIGRFQVDVLTEGHTELLGHLADQHDKRLILLGVSPTPPSARNPLSFAARAPMLREKLEDAIILPLVDCSTNEQWSQRVDAAIEAAFPRHRATLYHGRDGFGGAYLGRHEVIEVDCTEEDGSGTARRASIANFIEEDDTFRRGIIHAHQQWPNRTSPTVDVALVRGDEVLLGRKPGEQGWRFPGGFVDPTDPTLEAAARRELLEETGMSSEGSYQYVTSLNVGDWRDRANPGHATITTLFVAPYSWGTPAAGDDLAEVGWFHLGRVRQSKIVPEHRALLPELMRHLGIEVQADA